MLTHERRMAATSFIWNNSARKITVPEIAAHVGMSRYYFSREFTAAVGMSAHQYVIFARLAEAKALLATTRKGLREIATSCGFHNRAHLCYVFRKHEGTTPTTWRRTQENMSIPSQPTRCACGVLLNGPGLRCRACAREDHISSRTSP